MSTAEQNADVVRRTYAAFNAADIKTLTELMPENASWHTPGRSRVAGIIASTDPTSRARWTLWIPSNSAATSPSISERTDA